MSDDWAVIAAREALGQTLCMGPRCEKCDLMIKVVAAALRAERANNPDTERLDKLEALGIEDMYLRGGKQFNPRGMTLRACADSLPPAKGSWQGTTGQGAKVTE